MEDSQQYQLGPWTICHQSNTLTNDGGTHPIDNKSMQVLVFLIEHAGEHVTKEQIFAHVWKNSVVADDILSVTVSKIRKVLGDNARSPTFIKTLSGVGYVLIAKVETIAPAQHATSEKLHSVAKSKVQIYLAMITCLFVALAAVLYQTQIDENSSTTQININSIAVLPFDDLSAKQDNQYFSDGLSDAIINQLSQIQSLKVISRYSSFTYRGQYKALEIGQALQVEALLDGSVQKLGDQVRINVRIFSTDNGEQLWSKTFDSDSKNIFTLQDSISAEIQEIIQPNFQSKKPPTKVIDAQAYEWYLMGQYHWRQRNPNALTKAVTYFKHSLDLEPDYADAHSGLAITYVNHHRYGNWSEEKAINSALPHVEHALKLNPDSPIALAAQGMVLMLKAHSMGDSFMADSPLAHQVQQVFSRSLELEENATTHNWYSTLLIMLGKQSQAIEHLNKALELNPLSAPLKRSYSSYLRSIGKPDSAQRMFQRALELESEHFANAIESTYAFRHSQGSIVALSDWHAKNTELIEVCSSVEYCERLVLAYLSIGANEIAKGILLNMKDRHGHFLESLDLITYGLAGDNLKILSIFEAKAEQYPNNQRISFVLAVAQFRANKFEQAKTTLLKNNLQWHTSGKIKRTDIDSDNYHVLLLYASILSQLNEQQKANEILSMLDVFLKEQHVFDTVQAEFSLAEVNAQRGNTLQAIHHLENALAMGWVESYQREWWPLKTNHFLLPLYDEPEFKNLLEHHQNRLFELRNEVLRKLNSGSTIVEVQ